MKSALYIELQLLLRHNPRALYLLSLSNHHGPQWADHRFDAVNSLRDVVPPIGPKERFAKNSFWEKFCAKLIWPAVFRARPEVQAKHAAWLREQRERAGENWPPPAFTTRAVGRPPQVRTGKE